MTTHVSNFRNWWRNQIDRRNVRMVRQLVSCIVFIVIAGQPAGAQTEYELLEGELTTTIEDDYEPFHAADINRDPRAGHLWFVARGARMALAQKLPDHNAETSIFKGFFQNDIRAYVKITVAELILQGHDRERDDGYSMTIPTGASDQEIHERFCRNFATQWGDEYTFDCCEPRKFPHLLGESVTEETER